MEGGLEVSWGQLRKMKRELKTENVKKLNIGAKWGYL